MSDDDIVERLQWLRRGLDLPADRVIVDAAISTITSLRAERDKHHKLQIHWFREYKKAAQERDDHAKKFTDMLVYAKQVEAERDALRERLTQELERYKAAGDSELGKAEFETDLEYIMRLEARSVSRSVRLASLTQERDDHAKKFTDMLVYAKQVEAELAEARALICVQARALDNYAIRLGGGSS